MSEERVVIDGDPFGSPIPSSTQTSVAPTGVPTPSSTQTTQIQTQIAPTGVPTPTVGGGGGYQS